MTKAVNYEQAGFFKLHTGLDYDEFGFDEKYFDDLLSHMGVNADQVDWDTFISKHLSALTAYFQARKEEKNWISIDTENKALSRVQSIANNLSDALDELETIGQAGKRLHSEILANEKTAFKHDKTTLANLLGHPDYKRFDGITDLMFDISVGLERAKIRKPKKLSSPRFKGDPKKWQKLQSQYIVKVVAAINSGENLGDQNRTSTQEHALPANYALLSFVWHFEELWHEFTALQFTEGKHEPDARQHISRTVDAAEFSLRKFGTNYPRSLIERKVRQVREVKYEVSS
jgi:hypothetical protein